MLHAANLTKYNYGKYRGNQAFGKSIEAKGNAKTPSCTVEFCLSKFLQICRFHQPKRMSLWREAIQVRSRESYVRRCKNLQLVCYK